MIEGSEKRDAGYPVDKIFVDRWSPRAMTGEGIREEELMTLFEAARWAPSSYNNQPWRILYARRDTDLKDYALIFFETRDHEPKIKQVVRANDEGHAGRPLDEKQNSSGSFTLRDAEAASQIRAAFVHAIKLCQAQR